MATMVTPEDVLASGAMRPVPYGGSASGDTLDLLRGPTLLAAPDPLARAKLRCATKNNWASRYATAVAGIVVVGLACWAITRWIPHPDVPVNAGGVRSVDGLTIFAAFFVAALGIERLLEPLSNAILPKASTAQNAENAMRDAKGETQSFLSAAQDAKRMPGFDTALPAEAGDASDGGGDAEPSAPDPSAANSAIEKAAAAKEKLNVLGFQRTTVFWAIATCLGMATAAAMNLYFLNTVGITVGTRWEEVLATGLIVGAGTKPLHDLVALISAKSTAVVQDSA